MQIRSIYLRKTTKYQHKKQGKYLPAAIVFVCMVIVAVIISLLLRFVNIYQKSFFDGQHQFVLGIDGVNSDSSDILIFSPDRPAVSAIVFNGERNSRAVADTLLVPLDGELKKGDVMKQKNIEQFFRANILHFNNTSSVTSIDIIRLWWFVRALKKSQISVQTFRMPLTADDLQTIQPLFIDNKLYQEGKTVAILNASGILGYGGKVGKSLSNIGIDVIAVSTADRQAKTTTIVYSGNISYTLRRLEHIFGVKAVLRQGGNLPIADILVTVGNNNPINKYTNKQINAE